MRLFKSSKPQQKPTSVCKTIVIGGEAGEGIKSAGKTVALSLIRKKLNVFVYDEYPSLIRGGHNSVNITYSPYPVYAPNKEIDILVCLDRKTFDTHKQYLNPNSFIVYDREEFQLNDEDLSDFPCELVEIPTKQILKQDNLPRITTNTINISAALCLAGVKKSSICKVVKEQFGKKANVLADNLKAVDSGYTSIEEYIGVKDFTDQDRENAKSANLIEGERYLITGNEAISLGAIKAGMQFYAAYPMTPASTILDFLSGKFREYDFIVKQTEDEIAAINMAIGASFAGARAMVGTSGGGFSLMVEGLGLAAITETPLVLVVSQRPGPATGMPTWTSQSDLMFILHASQDEFPRIILTPTDTEECFYFSFLAFNLAEKYQLPVFIVPDKYLSESMQIMSLQDRHYTIDRGALVSERVIDRMGEFNRYEITEDGISPRSIPGQKGGIFLANSDEGDTKGFTSEDNSNRKNRMEKRFRKMSTVLSDLPEMNVYGDLEAKTCLITWGSTKGPALEAMRRLQSIGKPTKLIALNYVEPFPTSDFIRILRSSKNHLIIEGNYTSQLSKVISLNTQLNIQNKLLKFDGRPFYAEEIVEYILENNL